MKKLLLTFVITLFVTISVRGQNFVFIGENSFPSTERFTLHSNSDDEDINDLRLVFAKDGERALVIVSSKLTDAVEIAGKLIIYLNNGTVISSKDSGIKDNVDDIAISAYYLTTGDLNKLKKSNLNTIRYQIVCPMCGPYNSWEGNYSASNNGDSKTDFTEVVSDFYKI